MSARWGQPEEPAVLEDAGALLYVVLWLFLLTGGLWLAGTLLP